MKLRKTSLATFGIAGAIILSATMGISYVRQSQSEGQLRQDLAQVESRIAKLPALVSTENLINQQKEAEAAIAQAQSGIDEAKARLRTSLESIEVTGQIASIAGDCRVNLTGIDSPGPNAEQLNGASFRALQVTAKAEGNVPDLVKFLNQVTAKFPTASVKSSTISVPVPDLSGKEVRTPSIIFTLTIYSDEGA